GRGKLIRGITHLQTVEALLSGTMDSVLWRFFFRRSSLTTNCNGSQKAFVTQTNSPLRTTIVYDWENRKRTVTEDLFSNFPKDVPFSDKILDTCAVVGNGGILTNSSCGAAIDSAQFVIRCNLPPLGNGYSKHVGKKTDLVTANPSILKNKYGSLTGRRRAFVDYVSIYGDAYMFLPAFSNSFCTTMSMTTLYTLEDFRSSVKAVFMNPDYLRSLDKYWRAQGVKPGSRMSTGFMMVSLALEICNNVDVYGFWPFDNHPYGFQSLTRHYYDDDKPNVTPHAMPAEFAHLIKLHNQGVLKLYVGDAGGAKQHDRCARQH
uniref:ST8 alpha-N-acetyl-neuraminide alpha-2,8-sialyltransferase 6 n=1 Tax=Neogobius melanostomus TaxID=47308 RepID=A0A8C6UTP7_9GOBI